MLAKAYSSYTIVDVIDGMQWQGDLSAAPANPKIGWAYYNITEKQSYVYDGEKWVVFVKDGSDGNGISDKFEQYCEYISDTILPSDDATWVDAFPETWDGKTYIWVRTKEVWTKKNENGEYVVTYTSPRLASMIEMATIAAQKSSQSLADWCIANDVSIIDGSTIATGSIKTKQLSTDAIQSSNYVKGTWGNYSTSGTFFDLSNGSIRSKKFAITSSGDAYFNGTLGSSAINTINLNASKITSGTLGADVIYGGKINADQLDVTDLNAFGATIGGWTIGSNNIYSIGDTCSFYLYSADSTSSNIITVNSITSSSYKNTFTISKDGSVSLTGNINATSGQIGNFIIEEDGHLSLSDTEAGGKSFITIYGNYDDGYKSSSYVGSSFIRYTAEKTEGDVTKTMQSTFGLTTSDHAPQLQFYRDDVYSQAYLQLDFNGNFLIMAAAQKTMVFNDRAKIGFLDNWGNLSLSLSGWMSYMSSMTDKRYLYFCNGILMINTNTYPGDDVAWIDG